MGTVAIICIAAVVVVIVIVLTILVYNQMLLLNEVNKRLLLMAKESVDRERQTEADLQEALRQIDELTNNTQAVVPSEPDENFNPHTFHDEDLD